MKRRKEDLDLEYLNNRIDRLIKRFNKVEDLIYSWERENRKDIEELKNEVIGK
jgi:hypothetical protein